MQLHGQRRACRIWLGCIDVLHKWLRDRGHKKRQHRRIGTSHLSHSVGRCGKEQVTISALQFPSLGGPQYRKCIVPNTLGSLPKASPSISTTHTQKKTGIRMIHSDCSALLLLSYSLLAFDGICCQCTVARSRRRRHLVQHRGVSQRSLVLFIIV